MPDSDRPDGDAPDIDDHSAMNRWARPRAVAIGWCRGIWKCCGQDDFGRYCDVTGRFDHQES